ncbi:hypothetical protein [uncultured Chryseobacterium sp.]|uniref:DUF7151 family protein n=1 Tax=uncultured Chryseobacterium sp. TaxID=259322 RepID=UPI0025F99FA4|nr:hypothetical protein [uncultured Chryseobacterium sp.]
MNRKLHVMGIFLFSISWANAQVGINTQSPTAALHVVSKGNAATTQALKVHNSDGTNLLTINDDGTVTGSAASNLGGTGSGTNGKNALVKTTPEAAGANCSTGGIKIESGLDNNNNGTLEVSEITDTKYICNGAAGAAGSDGKSVLNGTVNPSSSTGNNGDFYINTATNFLFGPKAGGNWPAGVSLVGPAGATGATGPAGIGYGGTSASAKTISLGSKTFAVPAGLAYIPGQRIRFVDPTNAVNFLEGTITSYSSTSMVVNIDNNGGSGTIANWNLTVGGNLGSAGVGVPTGGTTGQVLAKVDGTNYNTQWVTPSGAASVYPNIELDIRNNVSQSITTLGNGTSSNLITFSGSNSANASLTGGNTWNGTTFTVGSNSAGWYQINVQIIGTQTDGVSSSNIGIPFYMDLNNTVGSTMSSAILYRSNYSSNTNASHLKNNNTITTLLYLSAGNTLSFYGFSASNTVAGNTSNNGSTYLNIVRVK